MTFTRDPLTWDEIHTAKRWGTCPEPCMARFARRRLKAGDKVLDLGCGIGAQSFWLADEGWHVSAIDISRRAIASMESRFGLEDTGINVDGIAVHGIGTGTIDARVGDIRALPFKDETFDAVVDVTCIQHLQPHDASKALREAHRVLKIGGWLFSMTASLRHDEIFSGMYARRESELTVAALYKSIGFSLVTLNHHEFTDQGSMIAHWVIEARRVPT